MSLIEANWKPTDRQLRQFGLICLFAFPFLAWFWFSPNKQLMVISGAVGAAIAVSGFVYPRVVLPLFLMLMLVATPIGMVVGELAMVLIYYLVFLPIGLVFRIMNRDRLARSLNQKSQSYWSVKKQPTSLKSYYRQS